jgi:hypothetical protein
VVAQKAPGKKTIKTGGARGQGRSYTRSKLPISHMADDLAYVPEQFEAYADSLAESAGRSGSDQRPHHPHKTGGGGGGVTPQEQSTGKALDRLVKVGLTFDQLLYKYTKKVVLHDRPTEQPRSPAKKTCETYALEFY